MMFEERSQVPPHICATELSAIVKQPFASQAIVESQRRIAELRKKNERVNVSIEESPRRFRHHAPAKAEPVVLPAQIDLAQLTLELALMGLAHVNPMSRLFRSSRTTTKSRRLSFANAWFNCRVRVAIVGPRVVR